MGQVNLDELFELSASLSKKCADLVEIELTNELMDYQIKKGKNPAGLQSSIYFNLASWFIAVTLHVSEKIRNGSMDLNLRKEMIDSIIEQAAGIEKIMTSKKTEELVTEL